LQNVAVQNGERKEHQGTGNRSFRQRELRPHEFSELPELRAAV
jgi:hypothetical protein